MPYTMEDMYDKISVHCKTDEERALFLSQLHAAGYVWRSGKEITLESLDRTDIFHYGYCGPSDKFLSVGGGTSKKIVSPFDIEIPRPLMVGDFIVSPKEIKREILHIDGDIVVLKTSKGDSGPLSLTELRRDGYRISYARTTPPKVSMTLEEIAEKLGVEKLEVI